MATIRHSNTAISPTEYKILNGISHGLTMRDIADELVMNTHTIIIGKKNLLLKLGAANSNELVRKGFELGLLK